MSDVAVEFTAAGIGFVCTFILVNYIGSVILRSVPLREARLRGSAILRNDLKWQLAVLLVLMFTPITADAISNFVVGKPFAEAAGAGIEALRANEATLLGLIGGTIAAVSMFYILLIALGVGKIAVVLGATVITEPVAFLLASVIFAASFLLMVNQVAITFARVMIASWYYIFLCGAVLYCLPFGIGRDAGKFFMIFSLVSVAMIAFYPALAVLLHLLIRDLFGEAVAQGVVVGALTAFLGADVGYVLDLIPLWGPLDLARVVLAPGLFLFAIALIATGYVGGGLGVYTLPWSRWVGGLRGTGYLGRSLVPRMVGWVSRVPRLLALSAGTVGVMRGAVERIYALEYRLVSVERERVDAVRKLAEKALEERGGLEGMSAEAKARRKLASVNPYPLRAYALSALDDLRPMLERSQRRLLESLDQLGKVISLPDDDFYNLSLTKHLPRFVRKRVEPHLMRFFAFVGKVGLSEVVLRDASGPVYRLESRAREVVGSVTRDKKKLVRFVLRDIFRKELDLFRRRGRFVLKPDEEKILEEVCVKQRKLFLSEVEKLDFSLLRAEFERKLDRLINMGTKEAIKYEFFGKRVSELKAQGLRGVLKGLGSSRLQQIRASFALEEKAVRKAASVVRKRLGRFVELVERWRS